MRLLLDLGNTRVKWGVLDAAGGLRDVSAHAWDATLPKALHEIRDSAPAAVCGASVVGVADEARIEAAIGARWDLPVTWSRTPRAACGVRNGYARPGDLGVDRFLAMVAAHAEGAAPCIVVSAGTALTLDALAGDGRHVGGLIAPGVALMRRSVRGATARVQPDAEGHVTDAATNTADALASGCWHACAALVDRFAARMAGALGADVQLLIGGGDAEPLLRLLEHPARAFPDAVLKGLAVWSIREG